jgi:hypothetical protein
MSKKKLPNEPRDSEVLKVFDEMIAERNLRFELFTDAANDHRW